MDTLYICDNCGNEIENINNGWVEWLSRREGSEFVGRGLRLVHDYPSSPRGVGGCQYNEKQESDRDGSGLRDRGLESFVGPDGLMSLLEFLHDKELPDDEIMEMIKRLHVPGYESVKHCINDALAEGVIEINNNPGFYSQGEISAVQEWSENQ